MGVTLENEVLKVEAAERGAELTSIKTKRDNVEYLWIAEPSVWGRHAPILFPIVGKVKNNTYRLDEATYNLNQHGFARDMDFQVIEKDFNKSIFKASWNDETIQKYPYKFELEVHYYLEGNNIKIMYKVRNKDDKEIYFSIGAHPGFNCPLIGDNQSQNLKFEDYYFEFENRETVERIPINEEGLLKNGSTPFLYDSNIIRLSRELFKRDALIFKDLNSKKISLKNIKNSKVVSVSFDGFPYLGLWSKYKEAPFVCIEPWYGHADFEDFEGDFREKDGVIKLPQGEEFSCSYNITISE